MSSYIVLVAGDVYPAKTLQEAEAIKKYWEKRRYTPKIEEVE